MSAFPDCRPHGVSTRQCGSAMPAPPLHVLLVSNTMSNMGGADRDWVNLANALGPERVRISWAGKEGTGYLRQFVDPDVVTRLFDVDLPRFTYLLVENVHAKRSRWLWTKILVDHLRRLTLPLLRLRQALRNDHPDIVISNTTEVTIGAVYAHLLGIPHVWCIKEFLDTRVRATRRLTRFIERFSSVVVVPSNAMAKSFSSRAAVVRDGNDVEAILGARAQRSRSEILLGLGLRPDRLVLAQIGAMHGWKGQHITAQAFLNLANSGSTPLFSLLFLGEGNSEYKAEVQGILDRAPKEWRDAVRFARFAADDFSFIGAADIVVHPSILPDPLPNAVREAMILGKAVIASRCGGIPEMIRDGKTGLLVEPDDPVALSGALNQLISSPDTRRRLGQAAQRFAVAHFDSDSCMQEYYELLLDITGRRRECLA